MGCANSIPVVSPRRTIFLRQNPTPQYAVSRRPSFTRPQMPSESVSAYHSNIWTSSEAQSVEDPQLERVIRLCGI
jgi:hypothetical protein